MQKTAESTPRFQIEIMDAPHEFGEFVDFERDYSKPEGLGAAAAPEGASINFQELFYSPVLSIGPGSAEPTPFMTPGDISLPSDFSMPPSYFSPAFSPSLNAGEVPDFELPKKVLQPQQGARVRKQPSQRRQKWSTSRRNSTASSVVSSSRHNSSASPNDEDEPLALGAALGAAPAATPASLMNVKIPQVAQESTEDHLNQAISATLYHDQFGQTQAQNAQGAQTQTQSQGAQAQAQAQGAHITHNQNSTTPSALRPRRFGVSSTTSSPGLYASPTIAPNGPPGQGPAQNAGEYIYTERIGDLPSKKTSHKIAEQERRNRINVAITELGRLVAPNTPMTSKAVTVETAIAHIQDLNEQIRELKARLGE